MSAQRNALLAWATAYEGWQLTRELAAKCPACLGWYLVVDENGKLTGEIADATEQGWTQADDELGCVRREFAR
jgi:hypothetical protein